MNDGHYGASLFVLPGLFSSCIFAFLFSVQSKRLSPRIQATKKKQPESRNPIYIYIYISQHLHMSRMLHKVCFPYPRQLAIPRLKRQSALLLTHSRRENNSIHTFPRDVSDQWNAVSYGFWTRVTVYILYNDSYTSYAFPLSLSLIYIYIYIYIYSHTGIHRTLHRHFNLWWVTL